jgi:hypothetical protein
MTTPAGIALRCFSAINPDDFARQEGDLFRRDEHHLGDLVDVTNTS